MSRGFIHRIYNDWLRAKKTLGRVYRDAFDFVSQKNYLESYTFSRPLKSFFMLYKFQNISSQNVGRSYKISECTHTWKR